MTERAGGRRAFDAIVVGGGFYGCVIAVYLAKNRGVRNVLLVEREPGLMARASYSNQARVHNGYHYPRSYLTAYRSRQNLPRFVRDWPFAVKKDFSKLYAIARHNSKVTARQFRRFCKEIGASLGPADKSLRQLFEPRLIEEVFLAEEYAFDTTELASWARQELAACGVETLLGTAAKEVRPGADGQLEVHLAAGDQPPEIVTCRTVINCTYSGLNQMGGGIPPSTTPLKHEITEMALMRMPPLLAGLGITVMDGPFFSLMPFPAEGLHTLSHVRYTPHGHWDDTPGVDPYRRLEEYPKESRAARMVRDAARYLPAIHDASYVKSLFEVKTLLRKNEGDDGRPILFEKHAGLGNCYSVLGGKIDNIYDVLEKLDAESFA